MFPARVVTTVGVSLYAKRNKSSLELEQVFLNVILFICAMFFVNLDIASLQKFSLSGRRISNTLGKTIN